MDMVKEKQLLDEIKERLIIAYHPNEIYLYGSFVWGTPTEESDLDFFVVVNTSEKNAAERIREGLTALKGIHADVDIIVYTKDELNEKLKYPSTLAYKIIHEGEKIYEAA